MDFGTETLFLSAAMFLASNTFLASFTLPSFAADVIHVHFHVHNIPVSHTCGNGWKHRFRIFKKEGWVSVAD
jgi:hypothetical protein